MSMIRRVYVASGIGTQPPDATWTPYPTYGWVRFCQHDKMRDVISGIGAQPPDATWTPYPTYWRVWFCWHDRTRSAVSDTGA